MTASNRRHPTPPTKEGKEEKEFRRKKYKLPDERQNKVSVITLAPSRISLQEFHQQNRTMPAIRWIDLCLNLTKQIDDLHQKNLQVRDLRLQNIMIDPSSHKFVFNTENVVAIDRNHDSLSVKEIGMIVGEMLNLIQIENNEISMPYITKSSDGEISMRSTEDDAITIINPSIFELLNKTIYYMLNSPGSIYRKDFIRALEDARTQALQNEPDHTLSVGYLNLQDYLKAEQPERNTMIAALKNKDEVFLVDQDQLDIDDYIKIRKELQDKGLAIMPDIIQSQMQPIENTIKYHNAQRNKNNKNNYIYDYSYVAKGYKNETVIAKKLSSAFIKPRSQSLELVGEPAVSFNQGTIICEVACKDEYKKLQKISVKYDGLCELISNYVIMNDLLDPPLEALSNKLDTTFSQDHFSVSQRRDNQLELKEVRSPAPSLASLKAKDLDTDTIKKSHILETSSLVPKLLAYFFNMYPHSIIPYSKSIKNDKNEVNEKVLQEQLQKLQDGAYVKFLVFSNKKLNFSGHSLVIKKTGNDSYSFFDPNFGEYRNLNINKLAQHINKTMKFHNANKMAFIDANAYITDLKKTKKVSKKKEIPVPPSSPTFR